MFVGDCVCLRMVAYVCRDVIVCVCVRIVAFACVCLCMLVHVYV